MTEKEFERWKQTPEGGCLVTAAMWSIIIAFALLCAFVFSSCKTKYITVPEIHTDTLMINVNTRDSVYLHDSIYVKEWQKGDTVFLQSIKWKTKYVEKQVHDTCYRSRTDTIAVPYPVEKPASKWQRVKDSALLALVLLVIALVTLIRFRR